MMKTNSIKGSDIIARHLVESGAYSDKPFPVIVTSGESLTPYFVNAEMLSHMDPKFLEANGGNSVAIINESIRLQTQHPSFNEDIKAIAAQVQFLFSGKGYNLAVSGGQRRDWIFSGPVANALNLPHLSLYKQEIGQPDRIEIVYPGSGSVILESDDRTSFKYVVHVSDLLTTGSSAHHRDPMGLETGWIPMLRKRGVDIRDLVTIVTRLQGGEE